MNQCKILLLMSDKLVLQNCINTERYLTENTRRKQQQFTNKSLIT